MLGNVLKNQTIQIIVEVGGYGVACAQAKFGLMLPISIDLTVA